MTLGSEFDFKGRLVYADLEQLFKRSFETELLDNSEILRELIGTSAEPFIKMD